MNSNTPLFEKMLKDYISCDIHWQADIYWQEILGPVCESFKNPSELTRFRRSPLRTGIRSVLPSNPGYERRPTGKMVFAQKFFSLIPGISRIIQHYEQNVDIITQQCDDLMRRWLTSSYLLVEKMAGQGKVLQDKMVGDPDDFVYLKGKKYSFYSLGYQYLYWHVQDLLGWEKVKTVLEIGSGYGGQAEVTTTNTPQIKYVCVDIPHWLYVNEMYLTTIFPGQVMGYEETSQIDGPIDIIKEMGNKQFAIVPTWKFQYINSSFDLFWNSKSLQEMNVETILRYGKMVKKLSDKIFLHAYHQPKPPAFNHEFLLRLFEKELRYTLLNSEKDYYAGKNSVNMLFSI